MRLRCRSVSTIAFGPVTKPPAADPIALPSVPVVTGIRPKTPCSSAVPRPVFPRIPVACESSTASTVSRFSQIRTHSPRFASSPSIEKTPSVIMSRKRDVLSSASIRSSAARSSCGTRNRFALHRRTPSMIEAWLSSSEYRPSGSSRIVAKSPSFAAQQVMYRMASSHPKKEAISASRSL